jgi:pimeloyl-ACP methyl ester carboxylesterase
MIEISRTLTLRDGATLVYRILRGSVPRQVVVLVHGMASNLTRWSEFVEESSLKSFWDIVRIDLRGNGKSVFRGSITMETWCDDLAAVLVAEGYSHAVLIGHCLGANLGIHFAIRHPAKTKGLILIEPLFPRSFAGALKKIQPYTFLLLPIIAIIGMLNRVGLHRRRLPHLDLREMDRQMRELMTSQGKSEAITKRYASVCYDLNFLPTTAYLQSLRELNRPLPSLLEIKKPVLLMFSTGKVFSDPAIARELCEMLENCTTVVLDSHHWIPTEKPLEMRVIIDEWCESLLKS